MTINKSWYSSKKDDWRTPEEVLNVVREMGPITLRHSHQYYSTKDGIITNSATYFRRKES